MIGKSDLKMNIRGLLIAFVILIALSAFFLFKNPNVTGQEYPVSSGQRDFGLETGIAVFPTWDHWWNPAAWWAIVLFALVARGPGYFSADRLLGLDGKH